MTSPATRRSILAGAAIIVPTLVVPAAALASSHNAELVELGSQLAEAWREERACNAKWGLTECEEADRDFEASWQKISAIVDQIQALSATTIEGLRVKALAILWCHGGDMDLWDSETTDLQIAKSIVHDLLASQST